MLPAWVGAIFLGFRLLNGYEEQAGPAPAAGTASFSWPRDLPLALDPKRANLVLVAHPRCPCTGATLDELVSVMTRCGDRLRVTVLFTVPAGETSGWTDSGLERTARRIPGVAVLDDPEGRLAARLGATASGSVLLFDGVGRLLFSGGITGARGHAGGNAGEEAVVALASGRPAALSRTPVFGCALVGSAIEAQAQAQPEAEAEAGPGKPEKHS